MSVALIKKYGNKAVSTVFNLSDYKRKGKKEMKEVKAIDLYLTFGGLCMVTGIPIDFPVFCLSIDRIFNDGNYNIREIILVLVSINLGKIFNGSEVNILKNKTNFQKVIKKDINVMEIEFDRNAHIH